MNETHTPSKLYRQLLASVGRIMDLTTAIHIPGPGGNNNEQPLMYKVNLRHNQLVMEAYAVSVEPKDGWKMIFPETDYIQDSTFWVGSPSVIFKDYDATRDRKGGKLAWAATYDRDVVSETFYIDMVKGPVVILCFGVVALNEMAAHSLVPKPDVSGSSVLARANQQRAMEKHEHADVLVTTPTT